jgi:hypothetical protein
VRRTLAFLLTVLALSSCATSERPEGIVERWLISLNQGAAGDPDAYAPRGVSDRVVQRWDELEPGELDEIEVGRATSGEGGTVIVPFRIVSVDGAVLVGTATVRGDRVLDARRTAEIPALPSEGGPALDRGTGPAWLAALGLAGLLVLVTIGLMRLVPEPEPQTGSST